MTKLKLCIALDVLNHLAANYGIFIIAFCHIAVTHGYQYKTDKQQKRRVNA